MSSIKPARRYQPAFYPFKKEKPGRRLLGKIELYIKGPLFGCRMCGNCLLQETAFICPMECPKGMRNGPCGGVTPAKNCYIDETRKCVWISIYERARKKGREDKLLEILPPLDWNKVGTETWGDVADQIRRVGTGNFFRGILSRDKEKKTEYGTLSLKLSDSPNGGRAIRIITSRDILNRLPILKRNSGQENLWSQRK